MVDAYPVVNDPNAVRELSNEFHQAAASNADSVLRPRH
jgi:hypothetical protein